MITIDLTGRTAVVTGAGQGLGREMAKTLARAGANVVVNYPDDPAGANRRLADETVASLANPGRAPRPAGSSHTLVHGSASCHRPRRTARASSDGPAWCETAAHRRAPEAAWRLSRCGQRGSVDAPGKHIEHDSC